MIGLFANTLPVRMRWRPDQPAARRSAALQAEQAELPDHQHVGLAELHRLAGLPRAVRHAGGVRELPGARRADRSRGHHRGRRRNPLRRRPLPAGPDRRARRAPADPRRVRQRPAGRRARPNGSARACATCDRAGRRPGPAGGPTRRHDRNPTLAVQPRQSRTRRSPDLFDEQVGRPRTRSPCSATEPLTYRELAEVVPGGGGRGSPPARATWSPWRSRGRSSWSSRCSACSAPVRPTCRSTSTYPAERRDFVLADSGAPDHAVRRATFAAARDASGHGRPSPATADAARLPDLHVRLDRAAQGRAGPHRALVNQLAWLQQEFRLDRRRPGAAPDLRRASTRRCWRSSGR